MAISTLFPNSKNPTDEQDGYVWVGETIPNPTYDSRYDPFSPDYLGVSDPAFKDPKSNNYAGYQFLPKNLDTQPVGYLDSYMGDVNDVKFQGQGQGVDSLRSSKDWNHNPSMSVDQGKVKLALDQWKYVIDLSKVNYKISFAYTSGTNLPGNVSGVTYVGANDRANQYVVFFNDALASDTGPNNVNTADLSLGTWGGWTAMHELGHVLGLLHPQPGISEADDLRFTIMAYPRHFDTGRIPLTPGMQDIKTLQASGTFGQSHEQDGDTNYIFTNSSIDLGHGNILSGISNPSINKYVMTIWDRAGNAGGVDTIDASSLSTKTYIDLRAGHFSAIGTDKNEAPSGDDLNQDGDPDGTTDWNVGIAFGAEIENAKGGSADDYLKGNDLNNTLEGNGGNDTLEGGKGNDILKGGSGNDTYMISSDGSLDIIDDSDQQGQIKEDGQTLSGGKQYGDDRVFKDSNKHLYVQVDSDTLIIDGNILVRNFQAGSNALGLTMSPPTAEPALPNTTRDITGDYQAKDFDSSTDGIQIQRDDLNNIILDTDKPMTTDDLLFGSEGNDHIIAGDSGNGVVQGYQNQDVVLAKGGDDFVEAGAGNDLVWGGEGSDVLVGGADSDILEGDNGDDRLYADDKLSIADAITNGRNQTGTGQRGDWLAGGSGDDTIIGATGNDVLAGGGGNDLLIAGAGDDDILGDSEWLTYDYEWTVTDTADYREFEPVYSGEAMPADFGADVIYAGKGNDHASGGNGNDVVFGEDGDDIISGNGGNDILIGGAGKDFLYGDGAEVYGVPESNPGNDFLDGGIGNDYMNGGKGDDIYNINTFDDHDSIQDESGKDTLIANISWDAVSVRVSGAILGIYWSSDNNKYVAISGGTTGSIEQFEFNDKTLKISEVLKRVRPEDYQSVGGGDESPVLSTNGALSHMVSTATASSTGANFSSMAGTQSTTSPANTTYQIQNAFFADVTDAGGDSDTVDFGADVKSSEASFKRLSNDDLLITFISGAEITIKQHFAAGNAHRIENLQFSDVMLDTSTLDYLTPSITVASQGNDTLLGTANNDVLNGLAGNDTLIGGAGNDTYIFAQGYDADTIVENDATTGNADTLNFKDLKSNEVKMQRVDNDLVFSSLIDSTDKLTIQAFFSGTANQVETISFSDGVNWTFSDIVANLRIDGTQGDDFLAGFVNSDDRIFGLAGNDQLQGLSGNDYLDGGDGNDNLFGQAGNDTLTGGAGSDVLQGNTGDDTYIFNLGDGQDTIAEETDTVGDVLKFGAGIQTSDIVASTSGSSLVLSHINGQDKVTILNWYAGAGYRLKEIQFADGTIWSADNVGYLGSLRGSEGTDYIYGTSQNETLYGLGGDDYLSGNGGYDTLIGGQGNDTIYGGYNSYMNQSTYLYSLGDGRDHILISNPYRDILHFDSSILSTDISVRRVNNDLVLTHQNGTDSVTIDNWYGGYSMLARVEFSDGTIWTANTLSSMGTNINDTYLFNIGDGLKTIDDWGGTDTLNIASGIKDTDIVISRAGSDLQLAHINGVDKFVVHDWFNDVNKQIENIVFTGSGTQLSKSQINSQFINITGTSGDDVIYGSNAMNDVIQGLGGNDTIYGYGGNDQITGGTGNDTLYGGTGSNIYYFNMGDGQDYISPESQSSTTIVFGSGLYELFNASYVYGQNTVYSFNNSTDKVTVAPYYSSTVKFIRNLTSQADTFVGSNYSEYIYGLAGNDNIHGGEGADTMYGGDGDDILDGNVVSDPSYGDFASDSPDYYIGGKGNDTLNGNSRDDTYYFDQGDGNDVITEGGFFANGQWFYSSGDQVIFGAGITLNNIQFSKVNSDLLVKISVTDSITVRNWFSDYKAVVEQFIFNDGTKILSTEINEKVFTQYGTAGNDVLNGDGSNSNVLYGAAGNDTLNGGNNIDKLYGGLGNDLLNGGYGNDSYYFSRGDGQDQIVETSGTDSIYFDSSITSADVALSRSQNDLVLTVNNNSGSITVKNYFSDVNSVVENIVFTDGSALPSTQTIKESFLNIRGGIGDDNLLGTAYANVLYGAEGNDILRGFEDNDILNGDAGNDYLDGGAGYDQLIGGDGNDTYVYSTGYADDYITETAGDDSLLLDSSISITDLVFNTGSTNLSISFGASGSVTVNNHFANSTNQLERLVFADGRSLGLTDIQNSTGNLVGTAQDSILIGYSAFYDSGTNNNLSGGDGNDYLIGGLGADTLYGGNGNDWLNGGSGSYADAMYGNAGDDIYFVDYRNDTVTEQLNEGIDTVISTIAYTLGNNVENLTLTGTGSVSGTGNGLDNVFKGNSAANSFSGGAGNDTYYLSTGDSATESLNAGTDVVYTDVTYTLGTNIENGFLMGSSAINLTGNASNNYLTGNSAANILSGGTGTDTLKGGLGDDTYVVDVVADVIIENANEGNDTVQVAYAASTATTLTMGSGQFVNVENITVTGTGAFNLTGDANDNRLIGNASANELRGNAGNDVLDGLAGTDSMYGGSGNDTYTIDVAGDLIFENANEGSDTVNVAIATKSGSYNVVNNVENGILTNAVAFTLTGNALNNYLRGNAVVNTLSDTSGGNDIYQGLAGADTLTDSFATGNNVFDGGADNDIITGGAGRDLFIGGLGVDTITTGTGYDVISFNKGNGQDVINASTGADNTISLGGNFAYSDLSLTKTGNDLILKMSATDQITLKDWYLSGSTNKSVVNLQVIAEAIQGFSLGSSDALRNNKVENFNFTNLVAAFDAAGATANWQLTDARLTTHLMAGSDTAAIGGDLAYQYGKNGSLAGMGVLNAQSVIANASFGQTAQTLNNPSVWQAEVTKLA